MCWMCECQVYVCNSICVCGGAAEVRPGCCRGAAGEGTCPRGRSNSEERIPAGWRTEEERRTGSRSRCGSPAAPPRYAFRLRTQSGGGAANRWAGAVEGTRVQLVQGDGGDGGAVHGEGVAGVAGKVREGVLSHHGAHVHLRIIFLTAVILQRAREETEGEGGDRGRGRRQREREFEKEGFRVWMLKGNIGCLKET